MDIVLAQIVSNVDIDGLDPSAMYCRICNVDEERLAGTSFLLPMKRCYEMIRS